MADIKAHYKATIKKYSTFSLILAIVLVNIWLLNNGERVLPPDIYTQNTSIIYGIILAVIMGIWFITLYAEKRTHIITELYQISIRDSFIGMVMGTTLVLMVFWVVFGAILGETPRDLGWEGYIALIILHGFIVAPIETITAQKMVVDMVGYIPAAVFFAGMHAAVYGFSLGTMLFAFTMGYIWSRMIGLKTEKWYVGVLGMGFVLAWHGCYNVAIIAYQADSLMILSFAGPSTWTVLLLLLGVVILFEVIHIRSQRVVLEMDERLCEVCEKPLLTYQQKYCSKKCYGKANRGENSPHWKGGPASTTCDNCGKPITIKRSLFNSREHHFCCDKCYRLWFGRVFRGENASNWRGGPIELSCQVCGNGFRVDPARYKKYNVSFCSTKCKGLWMSENLTGPASPAWRGGISFDPYGVEFNDSLKEMIRERDNHECQYCGISESTLGKNLDVHHISYSKIDNRETNLVSLCSSCHGKTNGKRYFWEAFYHMKVQEKDSIQSRLHLIPQEE